jgi:RNA polymerase sigma-70 factor (ECF subfamily)
MNPIHLSVLLLRGTDKVSVALSFVILVPDKISRVRRITFVQDSGTENITQLLIDLTNGNRTAVDDLLPLVYGELRSLAGNYLRRERSDHTLQPTALVHEAYLRLVDQTQVNWQNRAHFFGVAAQMMRRILVDHARAHKANKRGSDYQKLSLDENIDKAAERSAELISLDDALTELSTVDELKSRIVELRYFGGLTVEETAEVLGVTPVTINRHWRMAKAWLFGKMQGSTA